MVSKGHESWEHNGRIELWRKILGNGGITRQATSLILGRNVVEGKFASKTVIKRHRLYPSMK